MREVALDGALRLVALDNLLIQSDLFLGHGMHGALIRFVGLKGRIDIVFQLPVFVDDVRNIGADSDQKTGQDDDDFDLHQL